MTPLRAPFDAARPALLASEQTIEGRVFRVDEELPWRELGINEHVLYDFWRSGVVYFSVPTAIVLDHGGGKTETVMMTRGPKVYVSPSSADKPAKKQPRS